MIIEYIAVFNKDGFVKALKGVNGVSVASGEIALKMQIELDDDVFTTPPIPTIRIKADRSMLVQNLKIEDGQS